MITQKHFKMVMTTKQFPKKISFINAATRLIKHQSSQKRSNFYQAKGARQKNVVFFLDILFSFRLSQRKKLYFEASFRKNFDISFRHEQIFIYFKNFIVA